MIIAETNMNEMPENCADCPLFDYQACDFGYCMVSGESRDCEEMEERPRCCPLKEVPDDALSGM